MIKPSANQSLNKRHNHKQRNKCWKLTVAPMATLVLLVSTLSGCGLERDEHTVQFQQWQQPNQQNDSLPVWGDVYSKSVNQEVYSPQGNSEVLP